MPAVGVFFGAVRGYLNIIKKTFVTSIESERFSPI